VWVLLLRGYGEQRWHWMDVANRCALTTPLWRLNLPKVQENACQKSPRPAKTLASRHADPSGHGRPTKWRVKLQWPCLKLTQTIWRRDSIFSHLVAMSRIPQHCACPVRRQHRGRRTQWPVSRGLNRWYVDNYQHHYHHCIYDLRVTCIRFHSSKPLILW